MAQNTYSFHLKGGKTLDLEGAEPPSDEEVEALARENAVELELNDSLTLPKEEVPQTKVNIPPPPSRVEQLYRTVFDAPEFITKPARAISDYITEPSLNENPLLAQAKGFLGGAVEGAASLLSPANILTLGRGKLAQIASQVLGGGQVAHGAHELTEGNYAQGVGDIGFGLLGIAAPHAGGKNPNIPPPDIPVAKGPVLPPDNMNQAAILDAIHAPIVQHERPQGKWDENIDLTAKPATLGDDELFNLARDKFNMGKELPSELSIKEPPTVANDVLRLPHELRGAKPRFNMGQNSYEPQFQSDLDKALFIIAQKTPSRSDASYLKFVMDTTGLDEAGARAAGANIKGQIKQLVSGQEMGQVKIPELFKVQNKPTAEFLGMQPTPEGGEIPLFNVKGGPKDNSTVTLEALKEMGIEPPVVPENTPKLNGDEIRKLAIAKRQREMDAKNKGFKGTVPDDAVGNSGDIIPPIKPPVSSGGTPPPIDPQKVQRITEAAKLLDESEKKSLWRTVRDAQRDILTSFDFSAPGRQGKGLITHPEYWKSLDDMIFAWGSKRASEAIDASIINHPSGYFKPSILPNGELGPSFAEQVGLKYGRGELFQSNLQDELPKQLKFLGDPIARSGRAYRIFLRKLNTDVFAKFIDQAKREGRDLTKDLPAAKKVANSINISSGRGSFGRLENPTVNTETGKVESSMAMKALNELFFSPHFQKSRVDMYTRVLNPKTYTQSDPIVRKEAWRSLLGVMGTAFLTQELARHAGAQINNDPTSSDFRKIKIGDSRIDNMSGLQQYGVNTARFLMGKSTSSSPQNYGKVTDLTAGKYGQQDRFDVGMNFLTNKLAPIPSLLVAWMRGKEFDGMPFEIKRAIAMRTAPIVMQDLKELYDSDPKQFPEGFMRENPWIVKPAMGLMPLVGEGLQTYGR